MENRKQPSKEEVLAKKWKAPLQNWCEDFGVKWMGHDSIPRLKILLSGALSDVSDGSD